MLTDPDGHALCLCRRVGESERRRGCQRSNRRVCHTQHFFGILDRLPGFIDKCVKESGGREGIGSGLFQIQIGRQFLHLSKESMTLAKLALGKRQVRIGDQKIELTFRAGPEQYPGFFLACLIVLGQ